MIDDSFYVNSMDLKGLLFGAPSPEVWQLYVRKVYRPSAKSAQMHTQCIVLDMVLQIPWTKGEIHTSRKSYLVNSFFKKLFCDTDNKNKTVQEVLSHFT